MAAGHDRALPVIVRGIVARRHTCRGYRRISDSTSISDAPEFTGDRRADSASFAISESKYLKYTYLNMTGK